MGKSHPGGLLVLLFSILDNMLNHFYLQQLVVINQHVGKHQGKAEVLKKNEPPLKKKGFCGDLMPKKIKMPGSSQNVYHI